MPDYVVSAFTEATGEAARIASSVPNTQITAVTAHASMPKLETNSGTAAVILERGQSFPRGTN